MYQHISSTPRVESTLVFQLLESTALSKGQVGFKFWLQTAHPYGPVGGGDGGAAGADDDGESAPEVQGGAG